MGSSVVIVADAGKEAGLGHISRSSAVAVALRCIGLETRCYAFGADEPLTRDGVDWQPLRPAEPPTAPVVVIDSYRLPRELQQRIAGSGRLVVMHDFGGVRSDAALVVSPSSAEPADDTVLRGLDYVALRPGFWGLPPRDLRPTVDRVFVTTGSGQFAALGLETAEAIQRAFPESRVILVRGPHAEGCSSEVVEVLEAPISLLEPLLDADLVVTAGGQTMLEAAAAGTPCVAFLLVENQRRQGARLAELGAVTIIDSPTAAAAVAAVAELAMDADARRALSTNGQRAIDGYGALRVALAIARLEAGVR